MASYDRLREDITTLTGFLEQVDQFTFLYQELCEAETKVDDEDTLQTYQESLRGEMKTIGEHGIKASYEQAHDAYWRLERYSERLQNALYTHDAAWLDEQDIGEPETFYGDLTELLTQFESIDSDRWTDMTLDTQ